MEGRDELGLLVEVGIGLAGFSGMVVAIRGRGSPHPWETFRAINLLVAGFHLLFLALLPFAIHSFAVTGPALWRLSSVVGFLVTIAPVVPIVRSIPKDITSAPYHRLSLVPILGFVAVAYIALALNALALGTGATFSMYYLAALAIIPSAAVQFVIVLVAPPSD